MTNTYKKQAGSPKTDGVQEIPEHYTDELVKNFSFATFVRVTSSRWGMTFSFGQHRPDKTIGIFDEILVPYEIALQLADIIKNHVAELKEKGMIEIESTGPAGSDKP